MDSVNTGHHKPHKMNPTIKTAWSGFKVFAANSNLHGLKYFSEKISVFEKLFWAITFIASIGLCVFFINKVLYKWQTSPVIVSFNEEVVPVWKVPFPAITICPQVKCIQTEYNFTNAFFKLSFSNNGTEDEKNFIDDISTVCGHEDASYSYKPFSNASLVHNLWSVAPELDDVFDECSWREDSVECSDIFEKVLTREGFCFTFNTLKVEDMFNMDTIQRYYIYLNTTTEIKEWSMETGEYTGNDVKEAYPRIGRQTGAEPDLEVLLKENQTQKDNMCNSFHHGFKVYMHHPADMPQSSHYYYAVLPKQQTALAAKFHMVSTSDTLANYPSETRQCYFPSDRKLKYFKVYTQSNCELECLSNHTYKLCSCVWFHMPHDNSSQICGSGNKDCTITAADILAFDEIGIGKTKGKSACNCLPACHSVRYDAEILKTDFAYKTFSKSFHSSIYNLSASELNGYIGGTEFSKLYVFFKDSRFVSMRRSELFGTTDFLANCGGLLGLFMGFSFLSIIEIFYFLIIRVLCKIWQKNDKVKTTSTNITEIAYTSKTDK